MVALLITNFAFAYWSDTFEVFMLGEFTISKHYEDDVLVFTLKMPTALIHTDIIFLFLDFTPSDDMYDGEVWIWHDDWVYVEFPGDEYKPDWMTVDTPEDTDTLSIGIAIEDGSPLGSELSYRFVLQGIMGTYSFQYPVELDFTKTDTSKWMEEEVVFPEFVIPETPLGTIIALMSMVFAFILYRKIGH